ncbi:hypothetical protein [Streptomyces silaceus]|uniref:hypothetical protein n=1 Tax=Streptomyces silaceus TaxID=545123 RepID=UPI0006EBBDFE|nr:hypothetical protein [Streptomyces silaceus]
MRRTAITALLTAAALALAGCSSSDDSEPPKATKTVTKTPKLSAAEQREACVDAWADVLLADEDAELEAEPEECDGLPDDDQLDRYMEGMQKRNEINRAAL